MASHSEADKKKNPDRTTAARAAAASPPAGLLALQRSAGNTAVTAWLETSGVARSGQPRRDDHQHSPGCGHETRARPGAATGAGSRAPRSSGPLEAAGITALQRCVGNAAVSTVVSRSVSALAEAGEETTGQERSEEPQVQRLAIHDVLRSPGRPLDSGMREEMEQRFGGADFGSVRIHTGDQAARSADELQAQAYTMHNHVVFNKGVESNKRVVAHELAHVEENMKGSSFRSVPYVGGVNVSEPDGASEIAAEQTAHRVMNSPVGGPTVSRKEIKGGGEAAHSGTPGVQRLLKVGERNYSKEYKREAARLPEEQQRQVLMRMMKEVRDYFYKDAAHDFSESERRSFRNEEGRINWQLAKAIVSPVGMKNEYHPVLKGIVGKHPDFGAKNHDIQVNNYTELARNLMGWVYAKDNRRREKANAEALHQDANLNTYLNVLLRRLHQYSKAVQHDRMMDDRDIAAMKQELETGLAHIRAQEPGDPERKAGRPVGAYLAHFDGTMNPKFAGTHLDARIVTRGGLAAVMKEPENFALREKMIALHDLSEYFGHSHHTPPTMGKEAVEEIDEADSFSTAGFDHRGRRVVTLDRGQNPLFNPDGTPKLNKRGEPETHPSTRNENDLTTKLARSRDMPVWAGQSFTAARMFKMAQASGAGPEEIAAVGWGIFAFWRTDFDHTTAFAYHTLHEVMDIAQNFGVPYDIDQPYASHSMLDIKRGAETIATLADEIADLGVQAEQGVAGMKMRRRDRSRIWTDRDEDLLENFERVRDSAKQVYSDVQRRASAMQQWDRLSEVERSKLLKKVVDELPDWKAKTRRISNMLARSGG